MIFFEKVEKIIKNNPISAFQFQEDKKIFFELWKYIIENMKNGILI